MCLPNLSVVTGYGTMAPHSTLGKLVTMGYAFVGIPLTLIYLSNAGGLLSRCARGVFTRALCCCLCSNCGYCCYDERRMQVSVCVAFSSHVIPPRLLCDKQAASKLVDLSLPPHPPPAPPPSRENVSLLLILSATTNKHTLHAKARYYSRSRVTRLYTFFLYSPSPVHPLFLLLALLRCMFIYTTFVDNYEANWSTIIYFFVTLFWGKFETRIKRVQCLKSMYESTEMVD